MSFTVKTGNTFDAGVATAPGAAPQSGFDPNSEAFTPRWSFDTRYFGAPISRGKGSDILLRLRDGLVEVYKTADPSIEITIMMLDQVDEPNLAFSALIVCIRDKAAPQLGVAYHVLVVEATGDPLGSIFVNEHGTQVEYLKVTGDAMDEKLMSLAKAKVLKAFPQSTPLAVDGCVIPRTFDSSDGRLVHQIALNAGMACGVELQVKAPDFVDINLAYVPKDSRMMVKMAFDNLQLIDPVGQPMRSDVLISLTSQKIQSQDAARPPAALASVHSADRETVLSEISAFIDFLWTYQKRPFGAAPYNPYPGYPMPPETYFAPRMVITNIANPMSYTLASVLLSLHTAMAANADNNWIQSFSPRKDKNDAVDLRDIGALAIEANIMDDPSGFSPRIDTKADTFKLQHVGELAQRLVRPGLMVAVDVPECGPQTWYLSVFTMAAMDAYKSTLQQPAGMPPVRHDGGAYQAIYRAAMTLTNNHFGNYFPMGAPMFTDLNNRVHLGHWVDTNHCVRDIRDFDYLAVANIIGDSNPNMIQEWSNTWTESGPMLRVPLSIRLERRKNMIKSLTNDKAVFTGFAQRITFTAEFLQALSGGCVNAGFNATIDTPMNPAMYSSQRGVAGFANSALLTPGQSFFTQTAAAPGSYYAAPGYYDRRY